MAFNINDIRAGLVYGGARPNLFSVSFTNPINAIGDIDVPILARATQLPSWRLGIVSVPYFGRTIKLPGNREFEPWTITLYNDEDFLVRNALETWNNAMNSLQGNLNTVGSEIGLIKSQGTATQYGKDGTVLRIYQFNGIWPSDIGAIEVDWDSNDQIEQYQVTFQFDDLQLIGGNTGNAGGV